MQSVFSRIPTGMNYMLFCQHCTNKVFTDGKDLDYLAQVPVANVPKRGDGKNKETFEQRKKFKCPECGYIFTIVKLKPEEPKPEKKEPDEPLFGVDKNEIRLDS